MEEALHLGFIVPFIAELRPSLIWALAGYISADLSGKLAGIFLQSWGFVHSLILTMYYCLVKIKGI